MNWREEKQGWPRGIAVAAVAGIVYVLLLSLGFSSGPMLPVMGDLAPLLAAGFAAVLFLRSHGARTRRERNGWLLMGIGASLVMLGEAASLIFTHLLSDLGSGMVVTSLLRGAAAWLLFLGAMDQFFALRQDKRGRPLIDAAIAAAGLALPAWYFVIRQVWLPSGEWTLDRIVSALDPFGQAAMLFAGVAILQSVGSGKSFRRAPFLLGIGLLTLAFLGSVNSFLTASQEALSTLWMDASLTLGFLFFAISAAFALSSKSEWREVYEGDYAAEPTHIAIPRWVAPYAIALLAFAFTAVFDFKRHGYVSAPVFFFGFALTLLAIIRQVVILTRSQKTLFENQELTGKLRQVSENLEKTVERRTHQLNSLHGLTKAVTNTLDPQEVLSLAAVHAKAALGADALVLWLAKPAADGQLSLEGALQIGLGQRQDLAGLIYRMPAANTMEAYPLPVDPSQAGHQGGSLLRAPVMGQQKLLGMIGAIRFNGSFHRMEWEMLESIGMEVGNALQHARMYAAAVEAADVDPVTGLLNHRSIHQRLDETLVQAKERSAPVAAMMMDMNNFKLFNDTYGHPAGDEALRRVAKALAEACKGKGYVGRYGGDEFLAILPGMDSSAAMALAYQVRERLQSEGFIPNRDDKRVVPISLSFGIAMCPNDSSSRHELIAIADSNLYSAKRAGGGIRETTASQRENRELKSEHSFAVLDGMVTAVDNKDSYTRQHSEDVAEFSLWIAEELGMGPDTMRILRIGALLHDVGKICVPDEILRKPGRLTPEEFEILKRHPRLGALIVGGVPGMEGIIDVVQHHHERWDGKGYPDELRGDEIPLLGRLVAVADTFSAMTTDRPYRRGMDWETAVTEIRANAGSQFDPAMADAFIRAVQKRMAEAKPAENLPKAA